MQVIFWNLGVFNERLIKARGYFRCLCFDELSEFFAHSSGNISDISEPTLWLFDFESLLLIIFRCFSNQFFYAHKLSPLPTLYLILL